MYSKLSELLLPSAYSIFIPYVESVREAEMLLSGYLSKLKRADFIKYVGRFVVKTVNWKSLIA